MKNKKSSRMARLFLALFCFALSVPTMMKAQPAGPGVDPNVVVLDDFENGSTAKWTPRTFNCGEKVSIGMASAAKGDPVRFGNYALKLNIDFTDAQANQTLQATIGFPDGASSATLQIPGNGPGASKRLGMWIYATPGVQGMWMRVDTRPNGATSGVTPVNLEILGVTNDYRINWTGGWKYVYCNLPANYEFHPNGIRFVVLASYTNYRVNDYVIIDNIRVVNQSFSEDMTPPTISSLSGNGTDLTGTYTTSTINLSAAFSDAGSVISGMNFNSARVIVDGYTFKSGDAGFEVTGSSANSGSVTLADLNLSNGQHTVVVEVEDNFGHTATRSGTFTVNASDGRPTTVSVVSDAQAHVGNPFEIKINTNNSKDIKELEIVMELENGTVDATSGITFAPSAQAGSSYAFDSRTGRLTINLKNDITATAVETLATIKVNISKNCNPTDILRCSPVTSKAIYADNSTSLFSLFTAFTKNITATYNYTVNGRVAGLPGEVLVTNMSGVPVAGATVYALNSTTMAQITSAVTDANGLASNMNYTGTAQGVYIYVEKDGKYSYTRLTRVLSPLLTSAPTYIRAGVAPDPMTSKTITWMSNPVQSKGGAVMKLAKKSAGESSFQEFTGTTKMLEYEGASSGITKGSSVTVENLEPETRYIYQVGDGTVWSPTREFTTTTITDKFSFSAFGDLQASSTSNMSMFVTAAGTVETVSPTPFFNLNVGDIVDTDDRYDYYSFYGYLFNQRPNFANIDMIASYGNHEYMGTPDADNVKFTNGHPRPVSGKYNTKLIGTGSYAARYGNMLVIGLDWEGKGGATAAAIQTEQANWIDEVLTANPDITWKIVTLHYPLYPSESTPGSQGRLQPVFDKHNVQLVFCGHGHTIERYQAKATGVTSTSAQRKNLQPVIGNGTLHFQIGGIAPITGSDQRRWIFAEVDGGKMVVTVRDANNNGILTDESFTIYAGPQTPHKVNFDAVNNNGTLIATAGGSEIATGNEVVQGRNVVFTATPVKGYRVKEWRLDGKPVAGNKTNIYILENLRAEATVTVEFEEGTGIASVFTPNLQISPNPFADELCITGAENCSLRVINVVGKPEHTQKITGVNEWLRLGKLSAGVYFFRFEKDGQAKTVKVLKK